jgi:hypothetical protein
MENKNSETNKICCICYELTKEINICENEHQDYICLSCFNLIDKCPLCRGAKNEFYKNLYFLENLTISQVENLYNKKNFTYKKNLENLYPELLKFKNDFKFTGGKYRNQWLSNIEDLDYLIWFLNNIKLTSRNKNLFSDRINKISIN